MIDYVKEHKFTQSKRSLKFLDNENLSLYEFHVMNDDFINICKIIPCSGGGSPDEFANLSDEFIRKDNV